MNQKLLKKLGAVLMACVMLFGVLSGPLAPLAVAAAEEVAFSAAFSESFAQVGKPLSLNVTGSGKITYSWTVDGKAVGTGESYTPTEDDLMKWIAVTVKCGSDSTTLEMFFSKLPVVYINTENGAPIVSKEDYINADLIIQGNETYNSDTTTLYNGVTEIRGRGNSTWGQPKKPYKLKLDKKTDVFGMGKNKHWVLLANYMDESLQRNTLAYNLSGSMGMNQMSTVYVDVILNGDFIGNYQFCEQVRVDGTRVDVFDWEGFCEDSAGVIADAEGLSKDLTGDLEEYMLENMGWVTSGTVKWGGVTYTIANYPDIEIPSINGGYLLELDEYYDEISKFKTADGQPIMFKNPEFVNTNADMMAFVKTYIQAFENAVNADSYTAEYEGETLHYSELFDFQSLVDYWLINEIFFNEELNKKSTYMYKEIDELVHMGPIWDMDWSSGGEGQTYHTEQWATRYYSTNAQGKSWYKALIQDPYFFIKAQERYWEIRNDQVGAMLTQLDESYELLKESAKANGQRWGYRNDYKKYVDDLRNWFNNHLTWLDTQMATQDSLRDSLGYHPSSRLALSLLNVQPDYSKVAPADAIAAIGQELKLVVEGGNDTTGNAVLYVNGRRTSVTPFTANSTATIDVPAESLTAENGAKNVLEIQIEKPDGSINASRYITVVFGDHEHEYEATVTAPTCEEKGYTTYTCSCGDSYVADETDPLGHTEEIIPGKAPSFDETGLTDGVKCAVCGKILVEQEIIPVRDYNEGIIPLEVLIATAGDWQTGHEATEGPAELAIDDDLNTIWHTDWYGTSRENHWLQLELTESYTVDGLCYKPRQTGNANGTITKYEIQVSDDGETFRTVASGEWENNRNWKVAQFEGVQPKYVRLVALDAVTDNSYVFASAAEIRLLGEEYVAPVVENLALDAQIVAYNGTKLGDEAGPEKLFNGAWTDENLDKWCEDGNNLWVAFDLGRVASVNSISIYHAGANNEWMPAGASTNTEAYELYVLNTEVISAEELLAMSFEERTDLLENSAYWVELDRVTGNTDDITTHELALTGARIFKFNVSDTDSTNWASCVRVYEIEVIGVAGGEAPHTHRFGEWTVTKDATCTEEGSRERVCECGVKETEVIAALGHTEETIPGKAATCTETGLTEGKKCSVCGETLVAQEVIPALGHSAAEAVKENEVAPTCTEAGSYDLVVYCTECDAEVSRETVTVDALGHDFVNGECSRCDAEMEAAFEDVPVGSFYFDPVQWAVDEEITAGTTPETFDPNGKCMRAVVVTFLWKAAGSPEPKTTENPFTDVKEGAYYYKAVLWAYENNVTF